MADSGGINDLALVAEQRDSSEANLDPTTTPRIANITLQNVRDQLQTPVPHWIPPLEVQYTPWSLKHPELAAQSPVELFLMFFQRVLLLLVEYTNMAANSDTTRQIEWQQVSAIKMRRWTACRLYTATHTSTRARWTSIWAEGRAESLQLGRQRFQAIERYLSVNSSSAIAEGPHIWFIKVKTAVDAVRSAFQYHLIPSSHITVDESAIQFFGRQKDKYRMRHKPAGEGFIMYALCSYGRLVHDFVVSSSQEGIEGIPEPIKVRTPARSVRNTRRGHDIDQIATFVRLPPQKALVYLICERVTAEWRQRTFACYCDNLFVDISLAQALLTLNIGICGTTRKNTPGFPSILLAINHKFDQYLPENGRTAVILDNIAAAIVWKDADRSNVVSFISTMHSPSSSMTVTRRSKAIRSTRTTLGGFTTVRRSQPTIVVDYNKYMGSTDLFNGLREYKTVRRPHQKRWTTKIIEYIIDSCHVNAYLIWKAHHTKTGDITPTRELFVDQLISGLVEAREDVHTPIHVKKRSYCAWRGCQARGHNHRSPLGEVINSMTSSRSARVDTYCNDCLKYLCITKSCWTRYHDERNLIIRPRDRHEEEEGDYSH